VIEAKPVMSVEAVVAALARRRYRYANELELQDALAAVMRTEGVTFRREVTIGPGCRIDFVVADDIGLEVKVKGSYAAVAEQLLEYAGCGELSTLLLVTDRSQLAGMPASLGGTSVRVLALRNGLK
jgi:hypothetical protein